MSFESAQAAIRTGNQAGWSRDELRLTKEGLLGDLFDSGLRPYRFPRMETSSLEFKHSVTFVSQSDGIKLPRFFTETADISVLKGGLLGYVTLKQPPMKLAECRNEMLHWIQFGVNPKRTEIELDLFLKSVESDFRGYNYGPGSIDHDFRLSWRDANNISYVVWFQQARLPGTPLAIYMSISWNRTPIQSSASYDIPIPPPPGYENVDMTAPKDFGPDNPPEDPEIERVRKAGRIPDYSTLPKEKIRSGILPPGHTTVPGQRTAAPIASFSTWIVWIGGLALALFCFIAYALLKKRATK